MIFYNKRIFERCFHYKGKYWYRNIKNIPLYFELIHYLIKHGYDEYASWETFNWFIDIMKSILMKYNSGRCGTPIVIDNYFKLQESGIDADEENEKAWNDIVNRMIELLDLMDESNVSYEDTDYEWQYSEMNKAKDEFFELFAKYFYNLWD